MFLALFLCSAFASGFGTLIGFGGGIFVVPLLVLIFEIPIRLAVGAVALSLFPAALISTAFNVRDQLVDYKLAFWLELPTFVGALTGALLVSQLPVKKLEVIFSLFLIFMAYKMFRRSQALPAKGYGHFMGVFNSFGPQLKSQHKGSAYQAGALSLLLLGGGSGILAGLFGVGGGFMKTPIMTQVFKVPVQVAVATSLLMIVFTSLASGLSHYALGHIHWLYALPLLLGFAFGALMGQVLKRKVKIAQLDKLIAMGLGLAGLSLMVHGLFI